jgi:hypothetical protein
MTGQNKIPTSRITSAVLWWVNFYTRFVPVNMAQERRQELLSDIYEQLADGKRRELSQGSIDRAIASRALRGLAADLSWSTKQHQRKAKKMNTSQATPGPTNGPVSIRLSSLAWAVLALLALIGTATSITELVEFGGNRFGYVPWPGAGNINITIVQLVCSAILLVPATIIVVKRLVQHHARIV